MVSDPYQLILFDVDDTLLNFTASENHALSLCWNQYFRTVTGFDTFRAVFKDLNLNIWKEVENGKLAPARVTYERAWRALRAFGQSTRQARDLGHLFTRELGQVAQWLPGAEPGFRRIAGRYKVGLVTNGLSVVQHARIDAIGIRSSLSALQISEEAGTLKPRAEIFFKAMKEAGCRSGDILMVGDSLSSDFQGALNAGIDFCWVNPRGGSLPRYLPDPCYQVNTLIELDAILP